MVVPIPIETSQWRHSYHPPPQPYFQPPTQFHLDVLQQMISAGDNDLRPAEFDIGLFVAMDCEMVGVGPLPVQRPGARSPVNGRSSLARVSIVNAHGYVLLDKFVTQREPVTDYRTAISGVRPEDVVGDNAIVFEDAQRRVYDILHGKILVGHAVHQDLKILNLDHPWEYTRDTQTFSRIEAIYGRLAGLKRIIKGEFGIDIQRGEHSSVIDGRAAMALYRLFKPEWDYEISQFLGHGYTPLPSPTTGLFPRPDTIRWGPPQSASAVPNPSTPVLTPTDKKKRKKKKGSPAPLPRAVNPLVPLFRHVEMHIPIPDGSRLVAIIDARTGKGLGPRPSINVHLTGRVVIHDTNASHTPFIPPLMLHEVYAHGKGSREWHIPLSPASHFEAYVNVVGVTERPFDVEVQAQLLPAHSPEAQVPTMIADPDGHVVMNWSGSLYSYDEIRDALPPSDTPPQTPPDQQPLLHRPSYEELREIHLGFALISV